MQSLKASALLFAALLSIASGKVRVAKSKLDINQKVYIENQPVLGDGAGEGNLNTCTPLARQFVENPSAPEVKVCGTGIKATFFLMNRCEEYYHHQKQVGKCDTGMPPSTCDAWSPAEDPRSRAIPRV